jgi:ParB family chromosome partitioning protein
MLEKIRIDEVQDNPFQARQDYTGIEELAANIKAMASDLPDTLGLIHVPNARRLEDGSIQLAEGHRRRRAFKHLAQDDEAYQVMPLNVIDLSDVAMDDLAWSENQNRKDINPIEEAMALQRTMETRGLRQEDVAKLRQMARSTAANKLRLLSLPEDLKQAVADRVVSEKVALAYLPVLKVNEDDLRVAASKLDNSPEFKSWYTPTPDALKQRIISKNDLSAEDVRMYGKRIEEAVERAKKEALEQAERERQRQAEEKARAEAAGAGEGDENPDWLQPATGESAGQSATGQPATAQQSAPSKPEPAPPPPPPRKAPPPVKPDPPVVLATVSITRKADQTFQEAKVLISLTEGGDVKDTGMANFDEIGPAVSSMLYKNYQE